MSASKLANLFKIPKNEKRKTFDEDDNLPDLPVPDITHTLDRYLDSLAPFLSVEDLNKTTKSVRSFQNGVGKILHQKLIEKAKKERNWVEKWWEDVAYLQVRVPLLLSCNMIGVLPRSLVPWSYGTERDQIKNAASFAYQLVQFWKLIRHEELLPTQTADKKTTFSMSQYRKLFNSVRLPGETQDSLVSYFKTAAEGSCPTHVIVICKGRFFSLNVVDENDKVASPEAWKENLKQIIDICRESETLPSVGMLTCDFRSNWSKNRKRLSELSSRNAKSLSVIDQSMFILILEDDSPETDSEVANLNICGNYSNRWCDKSISILFYKNGRNGSLCDHTGMDGIVAVACFHYVVTALEETMNDDKEETGKVYLEELKFDVDQVLEKEMMRLEIETSKYKKEVLIMMREFHDYGKTEIQRLKFHPDSYVQMCLQLAYVSLHGKPAPCYETATTRKFYNGRTETVRSCTVECLEWVASMLNDEVKSEEKLRLFEKAVRRHDELMKEARENQGCDRHLFGLYCVALEEGLAIPDLFSDPAYFKSGGGGNFILSTSCTGYTPLGGGVAPMCEDGYGIFYSILPQSLHFFLSTYTRSRETNAAKYFDCLKTAFRRTREVILSVPRTSTSKL